MKQFHRILVGVDLSVGDKMVGEDLPKPTEAAVERAIWLAKLNSASLQFFYSLDIGYQAQRAIQDSPEAETTIVEKAAGMLDRVVERAKQAGVEARYVVTFGKSWLEMIRQVLREKCDLVIVGSKDHGAVERLFIGSTGMKLLRKCPCPVWVTHPPRAKDHGAILVGHDMTAVGDLALDLGASMAELNEAPLHVIHAIEPLFAEAAEPLAAAAAIQEDAHQLANVRIAEQLKPFQLAKPAKVHVINGLPATVLLEQIEAHNIDLVVMGTIARSGIEGLLFGNTAESLLPQIGCSVLAIKPDNFQSPITLEED